MSQIDVAAPVPSFDPLAGAGDIGLDGSRSRTWSRATTVQAALALTLFAMAAVSLWLVRDMVVPWDSKNHFYAMYRFLGDALAHGHVPLWNPYHFGGYPAVADPQSLIFTPSMFIMAALFPHASMQAFDGMIFAHLLMGGYGMLALFRRRGWHPAGAVLAAIIYMLGGPAASRLQHTGMIISYGYIPVALFFLETALERVSYAAAVAFGVSAALMAVGRDQVAFLACMMMIGVAAWQTGASGRPLAFLRRRALLLLVMAVTGGALLAIPSLLTMQFLADSNRPGIAYGVAIAGSLAPVNFATLFAPNIFGSLNWDYSYWGPGYETMVTPDWTDRCINYLFVGTIPALILFWHGLAGGRLLGRGLRFFLIVGALAILYALGSHTPVFAWFFDLVPGVELYRRPADATFEVNIALAIASGYLLHRYVGEGLPAPLRRLPRRLGLALVAGTVGLVALLVGATLAFVAQFGHLRDALQSLGLALAIAGAGAALLHAMRAPANRALAAALVVAVTMGELLWRNAAASINAEPAGFYAVYNGLSPSQAAGLALLRKEIAAQAARGQHPRVEILGLQGGWQNASMMLKLEDTIGYNPLRIWDYERAVGPGENAVDLTMRRFPGTFRGYSCTLASLLGLEYVVLGRPMKDMPRDMPRAHGTLLYAGDHMFIYRLGKVSPRATFTTAVETVDRETALADHDWPAFDRPQEVLIGKSTMHDLTRSYAQAGTAAAAVRITDYADDHVTIEATSDRPGILVLHDIYYPGWQVRVDGRPARLLRADILFRGVEVPAGHHIVSFEFHPLSAGNLLAAARGLLHRADQ